MACRRAKKNLPTLYLSRTGAPLPLRTSR